MTEEQIKFLCKIAIEGNNRILTRTEKELLKKAIDESKNIEELLTIAIASLNKWFYLPLILQNIITTLKEKIRSEL